MAMGTRASQINSDAQPEDALERCYAKQTGPHTTDSARHLRTAQWHVSTTLPCTKTVPLYLAFGSASPRKPVRKTRHYCPRLGPEYSPFICLYWCPTITSGS